MSLVFGAGAAWSNSGGKSGASGKYGTICSSCHTGGTGTVPTVTLQGPDRLDAGTHALYTFTIETDAAITGMNAAATDGVVFEAYDEAGTRPQSGEVVHARTLRPDGGAAVYAFGIIAPPYGGTVRLWAAGNAANDNGNTDGDRAAGTTFDVTIDGPPAPPPDASPPDPIPPKPPEPVADAAPDAARAAEAPPQIDSAGCAVTHADRAATLPGGLAAALAALVVLARRRRYRTAR